MKQTNEPKIEELQKQLADLQAANELLTKKLAEEKKAALRIVAEAGVDPVPVTPREEVDDSKSVGRSRTAGLTGIHRAIAANVEQQGGK